MVRVVGKMTASDQTVWAIVSGLVEWKECLWFVVMAQENNLLDVNEKLKNKHWQWQRFGRAEIDF